MLTQVAFTPDETWGCPPRRVGLCSPELLPAAARVLDAGGAAVCGAGRAGTETLSRNLQGLVTAGLFLSVLFPIWWLTASFSLHPKSSQITIFRSSPFSHLFLFIRFKRSCNYSPSCKPCHCLHHRSCKLQPLPSLLCQTGELSSGVVPLPVLWCKNQHEHHRLEPL